MWIDGFTTYKVTCSYYVPVSNKVARKHFTFKTCSCRLGFSSMGRNDEITLFFDGSNS